MEKLKSFAKQFIHDGKLNTNVYKTEDGYKILFLENDDPYCVTRVFAAYTFGDNEIGVVEHSYGLLTKANVEYVKALASIIGVKVEITEDDVKEEYPLKSESSLNEK